MDGALLNIIIEYGLAGMFLVAFLAATIVPLSSEIALAGALLLGLDPAGLLVSASAGNGLACACNYTLGYFLRRPMLRRLYGSRAGRQAARWAARFGPWSLLASWLPVVGDPLTIVAGFFRFRLALFLPIVIGLRVGRYAVLIGSLSY